MMLGNSLGEMSGRGVLGEVFPGTSDELPGVAPDLAHSLPMRPVMTRWYWHLACALVYVALAVVLVLVYRVRAGLEIPERTALFALGVLGTWRLSWFLTNVLRAAVYVNWWFPRLRRAADALGSAGLAGEVYVLITSYRMPRAVTLRVFEALFAEAARYGRPVRVMASMAGTEEQALVRAIFAQTERPASLQLELFTQSGAGKRVAMVDVLAAIQARQPAGDAVVAFMDGDTLLDAGSFARCFSFFRLDPRLGALTTDERAITTGSTLAREWFDLRFAQRHLYMSSVGLANRVLTLTGRFSAFRADIATHTDFIRILREDHLDHWRLGRIQFLTGDDKSTWYWVLREGWRMRYVPDVRAHTFDALPTQGFVLPTISLMHRWYGNMLRTNTRALALGPRVGCFVWWSLLEQRISMWTSLVGPAYCLLVLSGRIHGLIAAYLLWTLGVKTLQSLFIGAPRGRVSPFYPFLLYYNQVVGALVKIHMSFRLDRQRWTRQGTGAAAAPVRRFNRVLSPVLTAAAYAVFLFAVSAVALHKPHLDEARTQRQLERMLAEAKPGGVVRVAAGDLRLMRPLVVKRDDVTIEGAGVGRTNLLADFSSDGLENPAMIVVRGELPEDVPTERRAQLAESLAAAQTKLVLTHVLPVHAGDFVELRESNDQPFLNALGAGTWTKPLPPLRQSIARVAAVAGNTLTLEHPAGDDFARNTSVSVVQLRRGIALRGMTLHYDLGAEPSAELYANARPHRAVDGILLVGAAQTQIEDVQILSAGRHPLNIDTSYAPSVRNVRLQGAWNKGAGETGQLRIVRTDYGNFEHLTLLGLKHLSFQWSSHDNYIGQLDSDSNVSFRGGYSHRNRITVAHLVLRPNYPWPRVARTPMHAPWAPPDGAGNVVLAPDGRAIPAEDLPTSLLAEK
jgi:glycosyltransferase Alg8